jgi:hypothetical protein
MLMRTVESDQSYFFLGSTGRHSPLYYCDFYMQNLCFEVLAIVSYLTCNILLLQVLKCEYAVRGEIVTHAQVRQITTFAIRRWAGMKYDSSLVIFSFVS